jgi:hypothetical protein
MSPDNNSASARTTTITAKGDDSDSDDDVISERRALGRVKLSKKASSAFKNFTSSVETNCTTTERNVDPSEIAIEVKQPDLVHLISHFLHQQGITEDREDSGHPTFDSRISVYPSALATFRAPSDLCDSGSIQSERIRAVPSWRHGPARYDCIFVQTDPTAEGMRGLDVARVRLFFSFTFRGTFYPCVLVHWYSRVGNGPDEDTGMWVVKVEKGARGAPSAAVLHLGTIVRAAHLIGVYGKNRLSSDLTVEQSLDSFRICYVNKFIDHHSFAIAY